MTHPFSGLVDHPIHTQLIRSEIVYFDVIDSTNNEALKPGIDGQVFVADRQTAGRGRQGRSWLSAPGLGLWFSIGLDGHILGLTFAAALAVRDALSSRCSPIIKWPNDVLLEGKKVCGILVEERGNRTAVGIGINVDHATEDFPPALQDKAASLASMTSESWDRVEILRGVLTHLDRKVILLKRNGFEQIRREWAEACNLIGRCVTCEGVTGPVQSIDDHGALILTTPEGPRRILSGDILISEGP